MNVFVNGKKITLFDGAKVKDALLNFSKTGRLSEKYEILDSFGNSVDAEGALQEGSRLFVRTIDYKS
jgi:hypothetical protein